MGSNDHRPVPDPVQRKAPTVETPLAKGLLQLAIRVSCLENEQPPVLNCLESNKRQITELQTKVKEVIRSITRLAGGKSLGNLGLPQKEDWKA